jgi:hypothetical protein
VRCCAAALERGARARAGKMGAGESVLDYARFKVEVAPQQSPSGSACAAVLPCCELLNAAAVNPATHRVQQDRASSFAVCGHVVVTVVKATAVPSLTVELSCQLGLVAGNGKLDVKRALLFHTLALPVPGGQLGLGEHRLPFALQVPAHAAALPPSLRWQNDKAALQVLWSIRITATQPGLFGFSTSYVSRAVIRRVKHRLSSSF